MALSLLKLFHHKQLVGGILSNSENELYRFYSIILSQSNSHLLYWFSWLLLLKLLSFHRVLSTTKNKKEKQKNYKILRSTTSIEIGLVIPLN